MNKRMGPLQKRGFTLIETFIAITILMTAIVGPLVLAARGLSGSSIARDQITAYYLAQEVLEVVRAIRDENSQKSEVWDAGITASCGANIPTPTLCTIDTYLQGPSRLIPCAGSTPDTCPLLRQVDDSATKLRYYFQTDPNKIGGSGDSIYRRYLSVSFLDSASPNIAREMLLTVTVTWNTGLIERNVVIKETMFDWK